MVYSTHLVQECYRRLQDLLPFAELSLMKLCLKLQDLSPLPSCLRERTYGKKRGAINWWKVKPRTKKWKETSWTELEPSWHVGILHGQ